MDEIAPEYDVVVLGTGKLASTPHWLEGHGLEGSIVMLFVREMANTEDRVDGMCSFWVCEFGEDDGILVLMFWGQSFEC